MPWSNSRPRSADYGANWQKTRRQWASRHQPWHPCVRCGHQLGPMGSNLHLDHDDVDRRIIRGFAHGTACPVCRRPCNLTAGASKGARIANARRKTERQAATRRAW